jgi:hypothetical protein
VSYFLIGAPPPFRSLTNRPTGGWRRPRRFSFVEQIGAVPLSETEFLQTSLHLPLAIRQRSGACEVIAVVRSDFLARPVVRTDGGWLPSYMPIALRCLPFRHAGRSSSGGPLLEMAADLGDDTATLPFATEDGATHREFATIVSLLARLEAGREALSRAAAALLVADLLIRLHSTDADRPLPGDLDLLVVAPARLRQLTPARTAALARDGFLALDLATACVFSARLWASHLRPEAPTEPPVDPVPISGHASFGAYPIELRIDDSALFSFEAFVEDEKPVEPG